MDYRGSAFAEIWAPSSLQNPSMERCVWFSFTQCGDRLPIWPVAALRHQPLQVYVIRRMSEKRPTFVARKNPGSGWGVIFCGPMAKRK
jgi:hypothetical protein